MADIKKLGIALTANEAFVRDLTKALSVSPKTLHSIAKFVNTNNGINIPKPEKLLEIWKTTEKSAGDLSAVYGVLRHLFNESIKEGVSVDALLKELDDFCKEGSIPGFKEREDALRTFLTPKQKYLQLYSYSDYVYGVVPSFKSVSGVVQLRAAFANRESTEIIGYIPILQLRLQAEHAETDQKNEMFIFQVDEPMLRKLMKYLKSYQDQIVALKKSVVNKVKVYTRGEEDEE